MEKILVLGATGFIGGHIASKALEAGWEVHGFRRDPLSQGLLAGLNVHWHSGTLEDLPSLVSAMAGMDLVFHAAASYPGDGNPAFVRDHVLAGNAHAGAGLVVAQPMVVALQRVADELALGQGQVAVGAAILERDRRAVLEPIEHDRLAQDDAAERAPRDLVIVGRDVPAIPEEHGFPPCAR